MAYLGKGRREDLFVLATELNLNFEKSMTIATPKNLITGSEGYDEELTKNLHTKIVEDRKSNEERIRTEEQEQKLRTEEQEQKLRIEEWEEKIRIEELRIDEQKRKDEFELEKLRIQAQSNLGAATYQGTEKLEEFEDVKRTLKQKSSNPFVKKQEFKPMEKTRRYEAPRKFEYNRTDKKFPASANFNKHYEAPVTKYENVQRYQDNAQKGYYNKNYEKHPNHNAPKHAQTNYSKSQKYREPSKETCTLVVKEGLRTKEIFFGKKKITAQWYIDSGSTVSFLRENTSRRIMDPTKLSKNKILLTGIGEAQVTTIGSFDYEFEMDNENYSLT
ncbi:uncharacterized protein TNCT_728461 [Trichonephila clavata]|uniref:Peptidase A2 domain-containing protein n=1 Tax=Trichonephila clavata TaxID=2740835 RepID=A0A8X6LCH0_TRICU|nr:uncharacterized protein TNCT_728461 [Trichonephila clavata]